MKGNNIGVKIFLLRRPKETGNYWRQMIQIYTIATEY